LQLVQCENCRKKAGGGVTRGLGEPQPKSNIVHFDLTQELGGSSFNDFPENNSYNYYNLLLLLKLCKFYMYLITHIVQQYGHYHYILWSS